MQFLKRNEISDKAFANVTPARCSRVLQIPLRLSLLPQAAEPQFLGLERLLSPGPAPAAEPLGFLRLLSAVWKFVERLGWGS